MTAIPTENYTPPGVYVSEQSNPISASSGLPLSRLTLIGRGQGAQRTTEGIALREEPRVLAQKGIVQSSIVVTAVSDDQVVPEDDYVLDRLEGPQGGQDYSISIAGVSGGGTPAGTQVWVTYEFVPVGYDQPRLFTSPADVSAVYGPALTVGGDPTSQEYNPVNSPLTLAAEIAFSNGAGEILIVPLGTTAQSDSAMVRSALQDAYTKVETNYSANIVVPLTDGLDPSDAALVAGDLKGHLSTASAAGYFRVGVYGPPLTLEGSPAQVANAASSGRIILAYASPEGMLYRNSADGSRLTLGHQYLAAAYGGIMAANAVQQSLTRRQVSGFLDVAGTLTRVQKDSYAAAGVALTEKDRSGRLIIRHGTSTDRSDLVRSEPSVVRARDVMVTMIQNALDVSSIIGSPMDQDSALSVKSVVAGVLEFVQTNGTIVEYHSLQVRVQSLNPSTIEVRFSYKPSFPLNYILVSFAIDLSTGENDLADYAGGAYSV